MSLHRPRALLWKTIRVDRVVRARTMTFDLNRPRTALSRYPGRAPLFYFFVSDRIWGAENVNPGSTQHTCHGDAGSLDGSFSPAQSTSMAWMAVDPAWSVIALP